jgi:hypothetical protein
MQKFTQLIAEAILPVLGFYYWNWSWYFILLFYILDVAAKEVILNLQANKIYKTQGGDQIRKTWKKSSGQSVLLGAAVLIMLHVLQFLRVPNFSISKETISFLGHEEMGIAQGIILVPLIVLNVWMQYKMNFLKMNRHFKTKMAVMWVEHLHYRFYVGSVVALGVFVATIFGLNDAALLWSAVLLPFIYVQFFKK